jgi:hypothetical protein
MLSQKRKHGTFSEYFFLLSFLLSIHWLLLYQFVFFLFDVQGRNNLFQAIVMFLFYIKEKWRGFLHQTYLGTPSIGLLSIFDDDNDEQNE